LSAHDDNEAKTVGFIIDNQNLYYCVKDSVIKNLIRGELDHLKFLKFFSRNGKVVFANIYIGEKDPRISGFIKFLSENGFTVVSKPVKQTTSNGIVKLKCNFDVEIAMFAMDLIHLGKLPDKLVIATGDSDFAPLIRRILDNKCEVEVVCTQSGLSFQLENLLKENYLAGLPKRYVYIEDIWDKIKR
jgi:uncharacterized LabA/DUF88 family protein